MRVDYGGVSKICDMRAQQLYTYRKHHVLSLQKLLEGVHKSSSEDKPVNGRRRVVRCIRFASLKVNNFELGGVSIRHGYNVKCFVARLAPVKSVFYADHTPSGVLNVKNFNSIVVPHQKVWEAFRVEPWHLVNFEVKGVGATCGDAP